MGTILESGPHPRFESLSFKPGPLQPSPQFGWALRSGYVVDLQQIRGHGFGLRIVLPRGLVPAFYAIGKLWGACEAIHSLPWALTEELSRMFIDCSQRTRLQENLPHIFLAASGKFPAHFPVSGLLEFRWSSLWEFARPLASSQKSLSGF